ncbi:MAG: sulfite exporter TauE/SafE family protein [Chitinophagaceae bacterium]|nr:MAG: sulfite exporter TauE/SafE family protein [Chitinophagaceae bacterium]
MTTELILLCIAAFAAGFVDAIVGGGGLIQTPAALILLPNLPVASVIGTLKIPAFTGTSFAAIQYARKVKVHLKLLLLMIVTAFCAAMLGSRLLTLVSNGFMKPFLLFILIAVAIYTYRKKTFGTHVSKNLSQKKLLVYGALISLVIGFYDGFIGPGAGSFLIICFISILGQDFLLASAHAKFVNLATNLGSIVFFMAAGKIVYSIALPMAICNALGGIAGARLAILKGNRFIRIFFLIVVFSTILRFAYDLIIK